MKVLFTQKEILRALVNYLATFRPSDYEEIEGYTGEVSFREDGDGEIICSLHVRRAKDAQDE